MKYLAVLFTLPIFFACNAQDDQAEKKSDSAKDPVKTEKAAEKVNLQAAEFKAKFNSDSAILLDVRTPEETGVSYIEGASFINFYDSDFESKINTIDKSKAIYVYCKGGGRSSQAADLLVQNGFKEVYNLEGGIMSWENVGYNVSKGSGSQVSKEKAWEENAFNELISRKGTVLLEVKTAWCAPCKKMEPILDTIASERTKIAVEKIDYDVNKNLLSELSINSVPTTIIFVDGIEVWRKIGFIDYESLNTELDKIN